jgi:hypothetical protein
MKPISEQTGRLTQLLLNLLVKYDLSFYYTWCCNAKTPVLVSYFYDQSSLNKVMIRELATPGSCFDVLSNSKVSLHVKHSVAVRRKGLWPITWFESISEITWFTFIEPRLAALAQAYLNVVTDTMSVLKPTQVYFCYSSRFEHLQ